MKMKNNFYTLLKISFGVLIFGLVTYFLKFNGCISDNDQNWSNFSTYIGLFVNISTLILIGYISYETFITNNKFNELTHRPFLDLTVEPPAKNLPLSIVTAWYIFNCTNAAARNVKLIFWMNNNKKSKFINCYSVPGNKMIELNWLHYIQKFEIYYSDLLEENFYKLSYQNLSGITTEISIEDFNQIRNAEFFSCTELELRFVNFLKTQTSFDPIVYNDFLELNDLMI